jgi:hypothetical protein
MGPVKRIMLCVRSGLEESRLLGLSVDNSKACVNGVAKWSLMTFLLLFVTAARFRPKGITTTPRRKPEQVD